MSKQTHYHMFKVTEGHQKTITLFTTSDTIEEAVVVMHTFFSNRFEYSIEYISSRCHSKQPHIINDKPKKS